MRRPGMTKMGTPKLSMLLIDINARAIGACESTPFFERLYPAMTTERSSRARKNFRSSPGTQG
jgi:hypothetical protein